MTLTAPPPLPDGASACPLPDAVRAAVDVLNAELHDLGAVEPWRLSEDEVQSAFAVLLRLRSRTEALTAGLLASVMDREIPRLAGAASARAWLVSRHGVSHADANRLVREAATYHDPTGRNDVVLAAWRAGAVSAEQAQAVADAMEGMDPAIQPEQAAAVQTDLIALAPSLSFAEFRFACRHAAEVVDPEGADDRLARQLEAEEQRARRASWLRFRRAGSGMVAFAGQLPQAQADTWRTLLEAFTAPRHRAAVAATPHAAAECAAPPIGADAPNRGTDSLWATDAGLRYDQRLGLALLDLLEHLPVEGLPQHGAGNASIVITVGLDQLRRQVGEGLLATGTPISPGQVRRLACNAGLIPAVLDGVSRTLDLGRDQRLFDRSQRLALQLRDRGCIFPGCDRLPAWCEAHHITPWLRGGATNLDNGCLMCPYHHHVIHGPDGWSVTMARDGIPEIRPPGRLDHAREPRRHERFRLRSAGPATADGPPRPRRC